MNQVRKKMSTRNKNKRKCQGNTETQPKHHKTEDKNNNALWTVHDDATDSRSDITNENFDKLKPEALSGCRQVRQRVQVNNFLITIGDECFTCS